MAFLKGRVLKASELNDLVLSAGSATLLNTSEDVASLSAPATIEAVSTAGYADPGDGGATLLTSLPAAPASPETGIHYQRADGTWMELANGADATAAAMAGVIGTAVGSDVPGGQEDGARIQALVDHLKDKYGAGTVSLGWRQYQCQTSVSMPQEVGLRGSLYQPEDLVAIDGDQDWKNSPRILLHASASIKPARNSNVSDLLLMPMGYVTPTDWEEFMDSSAFTGTGMEMVYSGSINQPRDMRLTRVRSYGFEFCYKAKGVNRLYMDDCTGDGTNVFYCEGAVGDGLTIRRLRVSSYLGGPASTRAVSRDIGSFFDSGGKLGANLDDAATGLLTGQRIGTDNLPIEGASRVTVDVIDETTIVFRDIAYSSDYTTADGPSIAYQPNGSSVIVAFANDGGLTKVTTEVEFPFLKVGHIVHIGVEDSTSNIQDSHTIVTVHSPTEFTVDQAWEAGFAAVDYTETDFVLMPNVRNGYGIYMAKAADGLVLENCAIKGPKFAYHIKANRGRIIGCGSEGGVIGELGFAPRGTIGMHLAGGARNRIITGDFKTATTGVLSETSSSTQTVYVGVQALGDEAAWKFTKGDHLVIGATRPPANASKRKVYVQDQAKRVAFLHGEFERETDFVFEGAQAAGRTLVWPSRTGATAAEQRIAARELTLQTVDETTGDLFTNIALDFGSTVINGVPAPYSLEGRATSGGTARLTTDGAAVSSANIPAVQVDETKTLRLAVTAKRDPDTSSAGTRADSASWIVDPILISRQSGLSSIQVAGGVAASAPTLSRGGGSAYRLTVQADTTNGGLDVTFDAGGTAGLDVIVTANVSEVLA